MPPIPISASKAASLWLRSVEAGRPPNEMNRTARIAYAAAKNCFWGGEKELIPLLEFLLRGVPAQQAPSALLAAYLLYRAKCNIPPLASEPSNLVLKILNLPNPFLRLRGKAYTFRRACEGCFLHPVSKARGHDKLTTHLFKLQETASFLHLERTEQLGVLLVAVYLRNPPFAKFLLDRAQSKKTALQFSLLDGILAFWRATKGPGNRRAYLPPRKVKQRKQKNAKAMRVRPNRDTGKMRMRLADVLGLSSQFLDGSLEAMFIERKRSSSPSEDGWTVDVDMLPEIQCPAHKLMLPHLAESLRQLGRLGGGLMDDGEVESQPWNGPYSKCFGRWACMSPDEMREAVLADLEPLSGQKGVKSLMQKLSSGSSGESMVLINACKCIHVVKNWCFEARCNWWQADVPHVLPAVSRVLE